jgi:hypothetical protein
MENPGQGTSPETTTIPMDDTANITLEDNNLSLGAPSEDHGNATSGPVNTMDTWNGHLLGSTTPLQLNTYDKLPEVVEERIQQAKEKGPLEMVRLRLQKPPLNYSTNPSNLVLGHGTDTYQAPATSEWPSWDSLLQNDLPEALL